MFGRFCKFISLPTAPDAGLLVANPFAKIGRTIHELTSISFAKSEKRNGMSIRKDHLLQIEHHVLAHFRKQLLQDSYAVPLQVAAYTKH
jgi:hypothetical protein